MSAAFGYSTRFRRGAQSHLRALRTPFEEDIPVPKTAPRAKAHAAPDSESEPLTSSSWAQSFQDEGASRSRKARKMTLMGALLASAMLPLGVWTPTDLSANADGDAKAPAAASSASPGAAAKAGVAPSTATSAAAPDAADPAPLPAAPAPSGSPLGDLVDKAATALRQDTQSWSVRAIVGGKSAVRSVQVPTSGATVGEVLAKMNVVLGPMDRVFPLASGGAYDGIAIRVRRVSAPLRKRVELIPFETRYLPTSSIRPGGTNVVRAGRSGTIEITERMWTLDGKVSRREFVSRRVSRQPQARVVGLGSRSAYVPSRVPYHRRYARAYGLSGLAARGGSPRDRYLQPKMSGAPGGKTLRAVRMIELVATGYSPDPRENGGYTVTATGLPIGYGAAATDPRVIPLGTKLYVEGYGYAFACDTGGAIKGRRIDLAYNSYYEANTKGHKKVRVWILAE